MYEVDMNVNSSIDLSRALTKLLDSLGLEEENRQRRMTCQRIKQYLSSWESEVIDNTCAVLLSGSSYEATTIDGLSSDVDVMMTPRDIRVINNIQQWRPNDPMPTYMIDNMGCYPAFVKLCRLSCVYPGPEYNDRMYSGRKDLQIAEDGRMYLPNSFSQTYIDNIECVKHGPAATVPQSKISLETDYVVALRCNSFPTEAEWWRTRQTPLTRSRIGESTLDQTKCFYLVGVGNKSSLMENIEWRLSFSHIENVLVHNWNNTQYKCYVMMKFINKDLIKPFLPRVLCSYHFKTILMWIKEEYSTDFFQDSNIGRNLHMCLIHLSRAMKVRILPHYFVEGCNLFHRVDETTGTNLGCLLDNIINTWPLCLFNIQSRKLGTMLYACLSAHTTMTMICEEIFYQRRVLGYLFEIIYELSKIFMYYAACKEKVLERAPIDSLRLMQDLKRLVCRSGGQYSPEIHSAILFIINDITCTLRLKLVYRTITMPNKMALHYRRLALPIIVKCLDHCSLNTALMFAGYFTMIKKHEYCLAILEKVERQLLNSTIYTCTHTTCVNYMGPVHISKVYDSTPSTKEFCRIYHATPVTYNYEDATYTPKGLVYEMFRSNEVFYPTSVPVPISEEFAWYHQGIVHCPIYLQYLRFLCYNSLRRLDGARNAVKTMVNDAKRLARYPDTHVETNHNIIGHCQRVLGAPQSAYKEFRKSLKTKPHNNAAIWHLALLIRGKVKNDGR